MIFPSRRPVAIWLLSEEMAIDRIPSLFLKVVPILVRVEVSKNETACSATVAMNFPLPAREIQRAPSRIGDSASWDPVDTAKDLILLSSETEKIC